MMSDSPLTLILDSKEPLTLKKLASITHAQIKLLTALSKEDGVDDREIDWQIDELHYSSKDEPIIDTVRHRQEVEQAYKEGYFIRHYELCKDQIDEELMQFDWESSDAYASLYPSGEKGD
jgi:hypothetical protein